MSESDCLNLVAGSHRMFSPLRQRAGVESATHGVTVLPDGEAVLGFLGPETATLLGRFIERARERVQDQFIEKAAGAAGVARPAGMLLTWIRQQSDPQLPPHQQQPLVDEARARMVRIHPGFDLHVDKANHPTYDISSLIYLANGDDGAGNSSESTEGKSGFTGGRFVSMRTDQYSVSTELAVAVAAPLLVADCTPR